MVPRPLQKLGGDSIFRCVHTNKTYYTLVTYGLPKNTLPTCGFKIGTLPT